MVIMAQCCPSACAEAPRGLYGGGCSQWQIGGGNFSEHISHKHCAGLLQEHLVEAVEDTGFEARVLGSGDKDSLQLRVGGMTGEECSEAVQRALHATPGVISSSINLIAGTAQVIPLHTTLPVATH